MKVGKRSINFSREVMEMELPEFTKYFKESGIEKRSGAKAEDVYKEFKAELAKLNK
jgi:hypothetical protein